VFLGTSKIGGAVMPWERLLEDVTATTFVLNVPGGVVLRRDLHMVYIPMVTAVPADLIRVRLISTMEGMTEAIMASTMKAVKDQG
jgi:hypothetical protein